MIGVHSGVGRSRVTRHVMLATDCHFNSITNKYQITHALFGPEQDTSTPYSKTGWVPGTLKEGQREAKRLHRKELSRLKVRA